MKTRAHRWPLLIVAVYGVALLAVALWPVPVDSAAGPGLERFIGWMHAHGVPTWFGYGEIEFGANIIYYIPLGMIAYWWLRRVWAAILVGFGVSVLMELGQLVLLPDRYPTIRDVVANTLGTVAGVLIFEFFGWWRRGRAARRTEQVHRGS